jgi:hypothetical protein
MKYSGHHASEIAISCSFNFSRSEQMKTFLLCQSPSQDPVPMMPDPAFH